MAWLVVSKSNTEYIFKRKPKRTKTGWTDETREYTERLCVSVDGYWINKTFDISEKSSGISLPKGTIKKLIGRDLSYKDDPVKI